MAQREIKRKSIEEEAESKRKWRKGKKLKWFENKMNEKGNIYKKENISRRERKKSKWKAKDNEWKMNKNKW